MTDFLYGRNAVQETLRAGRRRVHRFWIARGIKEQGPLADVLSLARQGGVPVQRVERHRLDQITQGSHHQGVVVETSNYPYATLDDILRSVREAEEPALLLLLDCLQDPHNLGALLRTAEAVGVHGAIIPSRRSASVTPAVVSTSAGAAEHVSVAQVTNLVRTMERLKEADVWVAGLEAHPDARLLYGVDLDMALALVIGSEGSGLRRLVRERCDFLLRLPMRGRVESLNASVAGAVALYEILRQRVAII
jgi:23S rRNA (guanosine2251-2'-O)-methyltransferase